MSQGTRIGILREAFGSEDNPESAQVNEVVNKAIALMEEAGATVERDYHLTIFVSLIVIPSTTLHLLSRIFLVYKKTQLPGFTGG